MHRQTIMRLMALSINISKKAGSIIRDIVNKGELNVVDKGVNDFQTEADRSAQRCIIASLTKEFPNLAIIGEEGCSDLNVQPDWLVKDYDELFLAYDIPEKLENAKDEDLVVWVDPLDGTSEFTQGFLEHVTVLIGIAVRESAIGGIIHQPFYKQNNGEFGRTIWGLAGLGIGGIITQLPPQDKFIVTTTRSHFNDTIQKTLNALSPDEVLKVAGAGYKVIQLLEGKAHAYVFPSPGCKKWDTCAAEAVLIGHGGFLTDMMGEVYKYGKDVEHINARGVLASLLTEEEHYEIVEKIPDEVTNALSK